MTVIYVILLICIIYFLIKENEICQEPSASWNLV